MDDLDDNNRLFMNREVDIIWTACMMNSLYKQQKAGKHCDLKVAVEDRVYGVHRSVLASSSLMLDSKLLDLEMIRLSGVTPDGFECFVEILYSGKLRGISSLNKARFRQIVMVAKTLQAVQIMQYCSRERNDLWKVIIGEDIEKLTEEEEEKEEEEGGVEANSKVIDVFDYNCKFPDLHNHCGSMEIDDNQTIHRVHSMDQSTRVFDGNALIGIHHAKERVESVFDPWSVSKEVVVESSMNNKPPTPPPAVQAAAETLCKAATNTSETAAFNQSSDFNIDDLQCHMCGQFFQSSRELNNHTVRCHVNSSKSLLYDSRSSPCATPIAASPSLQNNSNSSSIVKTEPSSHALLECVLCHHKYMTCAQLDNHVKMAHGKTAPIKPLNNKKLNNYASNTPVDKSNTPNSGKRKIEVTPLISTADLNKLERGEDGKYSCPYCQRGFDRRWNLKCHILIHSTKKNADSNNGNGSIKTNSTSTSRNHYSIKCPRCDKPFRNMQNLKRHFTKNHDMTNEDLGQALSAANAAAGSSELANSNPEVKRPSNEVPAKKIKVAPNDQEKQFKCEVCGQCFKRNRNLRGHMDKHKNGNKEKYECHVCHRRFVQKESLNGHLWIHGDKGQAKANNTEAPQTPSVASPPVATIVATVVQKPPPTTSPAPIKPIAMQQQPPCMVVQSTVVASHNSIPTPPPSMVVNTSTPVLDSQLFSSGGNQIQILPQFVAAAPPAVHHTPTLQSTIKLEAVAQTSHPSPYEMPNHW